MRKLLFTLASLSLFLLAGCQKSEAVLEGGEARTVEFRVTNYEQYVLTTRADETVDVLDHLSMAIFTADTDQLVGSVVTQDKGSAGYGTFTATLPDGAYRVVFLGYMKNNALQISSSAAISFAGGYVPQTFLASQLLTVGDDTPASQDIVLERAVGAFRLKMADAMPEGVTAVKFVSDRGGDVLNAQTGACAQNTGRSYTMNITNTAKYWGQTGDTFTLYFFLPTEATTMTITTCALDSKGAVVATRTFDEVPMAINQLTTYNGNFFTEPTTDVMSRLTLHYDWAVQKEISY